MANKLYKFNLQKNDHNLFLIKNILFNKACDANDEKSWKEYYDFFELYEYVLEHQTSYYFAELPYEIWLKATQYSNSAELYRAICNQR